jgi:acyl-CoA hydrolase
MPSLNEEPHMSSPASSVRSLYEQRRTDPDEAVKLIRDDDAVVAGIAAAEPAYLLEALSRRGPDLRGVSVVQLLPTSAQAYLDPATTEQIRHNSLFLGGPSRAGAQAGWIDWTPNHFSEIPSLIRRGQLRADVAVARVSPMDEHGFFSVSLGPAYTMAAVRVAREVILEVDPHVPFAHGDCHIHVEQVSALIETDVPNVELSPTRIGPVERAIAGHVAELIPDGATLQIGIGAIPDAVVAQLASKNDLGIHTEMFGDGILSLVEAGVVTNVRKNEHRGKMLAAFALGSARLYEFMHQNPALEMHPVDVTNTPHLAGRNDHLHSINSTLAVDLIGQCGSESIGSAPYSGSGGQADFVRAANISEGGKSFIVVPSTAKNGSVSRIVPTLAAGTHVTTSKNDVGYVVTEYGVASLRGKTARQRAGALIEIAHPDFRDELRERARDLHLL